MTESKSQNILFYPILFLIPILFFIVLEMSLNLFDYGTNLETWLEINGTHYTLNPDVAGRYFTKVQNYPESIQDVFEINKSDSTYRVFVLGGSSAAGFPFMPLGSFSRYLRTRLELNYPSKKIEVVNLGLSAVNSYTILDLIPDVLEEEPDLILIYAGHNEYYGALGVGSMETVGNSRIIIKAMLYLNRFKTTELVRDIVKAVISLFSPEEQKTGTLMSRMAENKSIEMNSNLYYGGINQFRLNMDEILTEINNCNIPTIISTVASNLKDQAPFISGKDRNNVLEIFREASLDFSNSEFQHADSLYRLVKDLDELRFRAPEEINKIIKELSNTHHTILLDTDSLLSSISKGGIVGDNLMVDHLHLSISGYQKIGCYFYDSINANSLLPHGESTYKYSIQDSITLMHYNFSELDSTISSFQIRLLKNDWPFIDVSKKQQAKDIIPLKNKIDSLAFNYVTGKEKWEPIHRSLGVYYIENKDLEKGIEQFDILIHQYPLVMDYYKYLSEYLISNQKYELALKYLNDGYKIEPNEYYTKWIGIINLANNQIDRSIHFLEMSLDFDSNDTQVLYNLSGAYAKKQNYNKALEIIEKCLEIKNDYPAAAVLRNQLKTIVK